MPEFLTLLSPGEALERLIDHLVVHVEAEEVPFFQALNRVTAVPILAPHPLPSFPRSTVDGYAVCAADTYGVSESLPAYFSLTGEVPMGTAPAFLLGKAECALIHTGGMLPEGANAVVMLEYTQAVHAKEIEIYRAVAEGENVLKVGEDVATGQEVIPAGVLLRPAEIGGLAALGITRVKVSCKPRVGLLSTGDEILPVEADIIPGQVRDVNTYSLSALVESAGGQSISYGIVPDRIEALAAAARHALDECDIVVITAGSSASTRDLTAETINSLGKPGVLVHGVNVRPGKPTILAICNGKAVIGLPGNPVSALVIAGLFLVPIIRLELGLPAIWTRPVVSARLSLNLPSQAGREDWIPVRLVPDSQGYLADPVFGKSNLIFTLARADGLVRIPPEATGLGAGETVQVWLF